MSYTVAYYIAMSIWALGKLSWLAFIVSLPIALYLFVQGHLLIKQQSSDAEPVGAIIDWTNGGKLQKRALIVFFIIAPILYLCAHIIPDARAAMDQMGFSQDPKACMAPGETGILVAGTSNDDLSHMSFRLKDGVSVMCRIERMNAAGMIKNETYEVPGGERVSG